MIVLPSLSYAGIPAAAGGGPAGPTPAFKSVSAIGAGTSPVAVTWPATALNDVAVLQVSSNTLNTVYTIDTPSGAWGVLAGPQTRESLTTKAFWLRCAGTESGSVSVTISGGSGGSSPTAVALSLWTGCKETGDPFEAATGNGGTGSSMVGSAIVTTGANRRIVTLGVTENDVLSNSAPNFSERYDLTTTAGLDAALSCYDFEKVAAGSQGAETITLAAGVNRWCTLSFALLPT